MTQKYCCIFRTFALYREPIYTLIDKEFSADFYFGESNIKLKEADRTHLKGYKNTFRCIDLFKGMWWFKGIIGLSFRNYQVYLIDGNFHCISIWIFLLLNKLLGKKTFVWTHGWYGKEGRAKKTIKRCYYSLVTGAFLYGEYARRLMIDEGYSENKLFCIANSLDYQKQLKFRNEAKYTHIFRNHFENGDPVIIYIGRLQKIKKFELLLQAINLLRQRNFYVNLVLVGDNVDIDNLDEILNSGISENRIWHLRASFNEKELSEYFYNADVCISPGNVGLTSIHAFTYGCPVITHNNFKNQMPEFEVIEDGKTGLFFKENDAKDLSDKIYDWLMYSVNNREIIRKDCYRIIDSKYNPNYQLDLLKRVLNVD